MMAAQTCEVEAVIAPFQKCIHLSNQVIAAAVSTVTKVAIGMNFKVSRNVHTLLCTFFWQGAVTVIYIYCRYWFDQCYRK
jgi:hypothetical protein